MKYDAKFEMKAPGKEMHDAVRRWVRWTDMVAAARFSPPRASWDTLQACLPSHVWRTMNIPNP